MGSDVGDLGWGVGVGWGVMWGDFGCGVGVGWGVMWGIWGGECEWGGE